MSIPIQLPDLRIWLERKIAADVSQPGKTLRRNLVKLTPLNLHRLLDGNTKAQKPAAVLKA